jgi:predicted RNase H-like nuclease (RuvC/YqgF family)
MRMLDFENKISKIETEVAAMREKISFFSVIYEKFDRTLDKLEKQHNDELREVHNKIEELEVSIMEEIKALRQDMKEQHAVEKQKIEDLNKWRWLVMGGAVVVGWLLSKIGLPFEFK